MSSPPAIVEPSNVAQPGVATSIPAAPKRFHWIWATVACLMLAAAGLTRTAQEQRHRQERNYVESCPFPLKALPAKLGVWRMKEGSDQTLDSRTMRISGATDHVIRAYVDELTGVTLTVLLLFGPAEPVLPHIPEICYPAFGYSSAQDTLYRKLDYLAKDATGREVKREAYFRSSVYEKSGGLSTRREEAYHSFRLEGTWSPDVAAGRKFPRRNPGVFKLQIQRSVVPGENRERENPIDQFLSLFIPEIERQIASAPVQATVADR